MILKLRTRMYMLLVDTTSGSTKTKPGNALDTLGYATHELPKSLKVTPRAFERLCRQEVLRVDVSASNPGSQSE